MSKWIWKILFGLSTITLVSLSLSNKLPAEFRIVETYQIDWFNAQVSFRIYTFSLLFLSCLFLFGTSSRFIAFIAAALLLIGSADLILYYTALNQNSPFMINDDLSIISLVLFAVSWISLYRTIRAKKWHSGKWWVYILAIGISIGFSFIRKIYRDDYMVRTSDEMTLNRSDINTLLSLNNMPSEDNDLLVCFLSTSCAHCHESAKKIGITQRINRLPNTLFVFAEDSASVDWFRKKVKAENIPYIRASSSAFLRMGGHRLPSIFFLEGETCKHWIGAEFNNIALSSVTR